MKRLLIPAVLLVLVVSCTDGDDPQPASCQPTQVEYFNRESTIFAFDEQFNGFNLLSSISLEDGTQAIYTYQENRLEKIALTEGTQTVNYSAVYDGDKIVKLSGIVEGFGVVLLETRITYSGNDIAEWQEYFGNPLTGDLFQWQHYEFTYANGELNTVNYYIDQEVIPTVIGGGTPTYEPELWYNAEYGYGDQEALNPLYNQYALLLPELSASKNIPTTIIYRDADGVIEGSLGYELTFNDQGYPILANNPNSYIDIEYDCR